jgi:hypothetical protein
MLEQEVREKTRRAIEDLVEMADRLQRHRFDEHVREVGLGFRVERQEDNGWLVEFGVPDEKERDAMLYVFRLFDQQNEAFSFHHLNDLARDPQLSEEYRNGLREIQQTYSDYLAGYPENIAPGFFEDEERPTRGDIMRVVMNGYLGHRRDQEKRKRFKTWARDDIRANVLAQEFAKVVYSVLGLIQRLSALSKQELARQGPANSVA